MNVPTDCPCCHASADSVHEWTAGSWAYCEECRCEWKPSRRIPAQALADGRTACVERRTEDEHRDAFERDLELSGIDWTLMGRDAAGEYRDVRIMHRWGSWLACARAMGAVR